MENGREKQIAVSFTMHQIQLLDRLMEQKLQWQSIDELVAEAVRDFAERHGDELKGQNDD